MKRKCQKALNLLKVISAQDWGADRDTKLMLYRALIRSKLDYGCIVYGSARRSYLNILEPVQNQGLRLCLNAFRTSPSDSLHVEANEQPLNIRRLKLAMQYVIKLYGNKDKPTHKAVFGSDYTHIQDTNPNVIVPLGGRVLPHIEEADIRLELIAKQRVLNRPRWKLKKPIIERSLTKYTKEETNPYLFKTKFAEIKDTHTDYHFIYTDGSKLDEKAAASIVTETNKLKTSLLDNRTVPTLLRSLRR